MVDIYGDNKDNLEVFPKEKRTENHEIIRHNFHGIPIEPISIM